MRDDLTRHSPFGDWLGRSVVRADTDRGEIEVSYHPPAQTHNRIGTLAGGALAAMLDSLTGLAALCALPEDSIAVHTALAIDYLHPARSGALRGVGRALEQNERAVVCSGELFDPDGRLVARARAELHILRRGSTID
jgi:uncharacterized protein (TIGR00369 family)